jgi:hypothetical protein
MVRASAREGLCFAIVSVEGLERATDGGGFFFFRKVQKPKKTETAINSVLGAFEDSSDAEKSIKKVSRKLTSTLRRQTLVRTPA